VDDGDEYHTFLKNDMILEHRRASFREELEEEEAEEEEGEEVVFIYVYVDCKCLYVDI
jgi:hypothetical protein